VSLSLAAKAGLQRRAHRPRSRRPAACVGLGAATSPLTCPRVQPRAAAEAGGGGRKKNVGLGFFCLGRAARAQRPQRRFFSSYYVNVYPPARPPARVARPVPAVLRVAAADTCVGRPAPRPGPARALLTVCFVAAAGPGRAGGRLARLFPRDAAPRIFLAWLTRTRPTTRRHQSPSSSSCFFLL
jgi:hypothetical protein